MIHYTSFNNKYHLNNQVFDTDCKNEVFYIGDTNNNSNKNVTQIVDHGIECNENRKIWTVTILNKEFNTNICLPCKNGDFLTG